MRTKASLLALGLTGCSLVFPATEYVGEESTVGAGAAGTTIATTSTASAGGAGGDGGASTASTGGEAAVGGAGGAGVGGMGGTGSTSEGGGEPGRVGRLFALGGVRHELDLVTKEASGVTATTFADVRADGSVGPWSYGPPLVDSGNYRAELRSGELWLFGQTEGASGQKPVMLQRATLDSGGLGEWKASFSTNVLVQLAMPTLAGAFGYIATVDSQSPTTNTIHRVELAPSGTTLPAAFAQAGIPLAVPRKWSTPFAFGSRLLFVGGYSAQAMPTTRSDVEVFAIDAATGNLTAQPPLAMLDGALPVQQRSTTVCGDASRLYTVGGFVNTSTRHGKILRSTPMNGVPSDFVRVADLPAARAGVGCAIVGDRMYVAGGIGSDGVVVAAVSWAPILPDGSLGDWVTVDVTPLPFARSEAELVFVSD